MNHVEQRLILLYNQAKKQHPQGISGKDFIAVNFNDTPLELRYVTDRGNGNDIEFYLYLSKQRYARKNFIVYDDGRLVPDQGIIPAFDLTDNEPQLPDDWDKIVHLCLVATAP